MNHNKVITIENFPSLCRICLISCESLLTINSNISEIFQNVTNITVSVYMYSILSCNLPSYILLCSLISMRIFLKTSVNTVMLSCRILNHSLRSAKIVTLFSLRFYQKIIKKILRIM